MDPENITDIVSTSLKDISTSNGIISAIFNKYIRANNRAEDYLEKAIWENGCVSDDDLEVAARLYGISMMRKQYKNIAKTLRKADELCVKRIQNTGEEPKDADEDWLLYFLDRASRISNESVQNIFAYILTQECFEEGTIRKVMIDRLALLDEKTALIFAVLCQLTYKVEISDGRDYYVPLYLRDDILYELVNTSTIEFSEDQAVEYQNFILHNKINDKTIDENVESELELLQEIGLVNLSEESDEGDIYSSKPISFDVFVGQNKAGNISLFDENQNVYYMCTGNITYTRMGLDLYNALKSAYAPYPGLLEITEAYLKLQELRE